MVPSARSDRWSNKTVGPHHAPHRGCFAIERLAVAVAVALLLDQPPRNQWSDTFEILSPVFGLAAVATPALTPRSLFSRSWPMLWLAALASYAVSIIGMFSIGAFVFFLTCAQLGAISPIHRHASWGMLLATLVWVLVVPLQTAGLHWLWRFGIYQLVGLMGLLLALLPLGADRSPRPEAAASG